MMSSKTGRLEVVAGCMFAGKTEELVRRVRRASEKGKTVIVYKPHIDTRYSATDVVSHSGVRIKATPIRTDALPEVPADVEVVAFDEAQFFGPSLLALVEGLMRRGVHVIASGLDLTSSGEPFGIMPTLLALADEVVKLKATCSQCGSPANRSQRLTAVDQEVWVGGAEAYEPRCHGCHAA